MRHLRSRLVRPAALAPTVLLAALACEQAPPTDPTAASPASSAVQPPTAPNGTAATAQAWTPLERVAELPGAERGHSLEGLAADRSGRLHAIFAYAAGTPRFDLRPTALAYARADGARWSSPTQIATTSGAGFFGDLQLAVDGGGQAHVFWRQGTGGMPESPPLGTPGPIVGNAPVMTDVVHWTPGGAARSIYREVYHRGMGSEPLAAFADPAGAVRLLHWSVGSNDSTPIPGVQISKNGVDFFPAYGVAARGWVLLTQSGSGWSEAKGPDQHDIYTGWATTSRTGAMALVSIGCDPTPRQGTEPTPPQPCLSSVWVQPFSGGAWGERRAVHFTRDPKDSPSLAIDARGAYHVVWSEGIGGRGPGRRLMYSRSADGRSWTTPVEIAGPAPSEIGSTPEAVAQLPVVSMPQLHVDARDRVHVVFGRAGLRYATFDGARWSASTPVPTPEWHTRPADVGGSGFRSAVVGSTLYVLVGGRGGYYATTLAVGG